MRVFLVAILAMVFIAAGSYFAVNAMQRPSGVAYTTEGARIKQSWSYRRVAKRAAPAGQSTALPGASGEVSDDCEVETTLQWIMIDFGASNAPTCS